MSKIDNEEIIQECIKCGEQFVTDAHWKTKCLKCWLKEKHPTSYTNKYEEIDIICEKCGEVFVGAGWKTVCQGCWFKNLKEAQQNDLEEREQYDD